MALPGDQDGDTGTAPKAVTIPKGCVVNSISLLAKAAADGGTGATVDDSAFAPSRSGAIAVPAGVGYDDRPNQYVGDGAKQIVLAGSIATWTINWKVV